MTAPVNATPPITSAASPETPQAAPAQKKPTGFKFLQENQPLENLKQLADPKLATDQSILCITKKIFDTLSYSNRSPQMIRDRTINIIVSGVILKLTGQIGWRTMRCVSMHPNWTETFFPLSAECFEKTIHRMLDTDSLLWTFFLTSTIGLFALSSHAGSRLFYTDRKTEERVQMLYLEYAAMIEVLDDTATKCFNRELPFESKQAMCKLADSLKANIPLINTRLRQIARLPPERADLLTNQLSLAIERLKQITDLPQKRNNSPVHLLSLTINRILKHSPLQRAK